MNDLRGRTFSDDNEIIAAVDRHFEDKDREYFFAQYIEEAYDDDV